MKAALNKGIYKNTIAHLGLGTFSEQAALQYVKRVGEVQLVERDSISAIFQAVRDGSTTYGIVPLENTTPFAGHVEDTIQELANQKQPVHIIGEETVQVSLSLYRQPNFQTTIIASKDKALEQTTDYRIKHLRNHMPLSLQSTAEAVKLASQDPTVAAIAGPNAADELGITNLERIDNIQDNQFNVTRFIIISNDEAKPEANLGDKTSLIIQITDAPGSLQRHLEQFAKKGINLSEIKFIRRENDAALLLISVDGSQETPDIQQILSNLKKNNVLYLLLGSYPKTEYPKPKDDKSLPSLEEITEQIKEKVLESEKPEEITTVIFSIKDRVGSLAAVLSLFQSTNLTDIDSFPTGRRLGEYAFTISFLNNTPDKEKLLAELKKNCFTIAII